MARAFVAAALSIGLVLPAVADDASSTVETLAKKWVKAYNAHSGADIAAMFTQDAVFLGPPGVLKGAPAIEKAMDARFKQGWATEELKVNEAHAIGDTYGLLVSLRSKVLVNKLENSRAEIGANF